MADEYQIVEMPDGTEVEFPAHYTPDQIKNVMMLKGRQYFANASNQPPFDLNTKTGIATPVDLNAGSQARQGEAVDINGAPVPTMDLPTSLGREILPFIGGTIGGLNRITNIAPQKIALTGALAGAGELGNQLYEVMTDSPYAPKSFGESLKRTGKTALEYAAGQGIGEHLSWAMRKFMPAVKGFLVEPETKVAGEALAPYMEQYQSKGLISRQYPGPFTPAQLTRPQSGMQKAENIMESSFVGGSTIKDVKSAQELAVIDYAKDVSDKLWRGVERLPEHKRGQAFIAAYNDADNMFHEQAGKMYGEVDRIVGGQKIDMSSIIAKASKEEQGNRIFNNLGSSTAGDKIVKGVSGLPDDTGTMVWNAPSIFRKKDWSFSEAQELRSRLIREKQALAPGDPAYAVAGKYIKEVDTAMEGTAKKLGIEANDTWRSANSFYKDGIKTFDNEFMSQLVLRGKENAVDVGKMLFQKGHIENVQKVKAVLKDDPITWQNLKAGYLDSMMTQATDQATGKINSRLMATTLSEKGMGVETLKEIFTPKEYQMLKTFERALIISQKTAKGSGGSMLIQLMQAPAVGSIIGGSAFASWYKGDPQYLIEAVAILSTPKILGHMMVNPKFQKFFIQGMRTEKAVAFPAIAKLLAGAVDTYQRMDDKKIQRAPERVADPLSQAQ